MPKTFFKIFVAFIAILTVPNTAQAAQVMFEPDTVSLPQPQKYTVTMLIDTQGESINALEGTLVLDEEVGDVVAVSDSGSIITYWINRPEWQKSKRIVEFRGAIPGGFTGKGIVMSIVLPSLERSADLQPFTVTNLRAFRNDGLGSQALVTLSNFKFGQRTSLVEGVTEEQLYIGGAKSDNIAPEIFSPQISRDDRVFDGKWFISFATQDKQSGIDHYEIQETRTGYIRVGNWKTAESPYVLEDQELHSYVFVIAIDRQGNERVIKVFPRNPLPWYEQSAQGLFILLGAIVVAGAGFAIYRYKHKRKSKRKSWH